ncbi:MAG TPA: hypothetical protein VHQ24_09325 [Lachnospiraceae bacterium]|nr:hypothetical protein [Lachnospiraceae bacterium]
MENVYLKSVVLSRKRLKVRSYEDSLRIKNSADATNLYQKAFQIIEEAYPCSRLLALHRFLINIEMQGGKYQNAIDLLQVDIRAWVERSYVYQKELKNIKNKIILSLGISLGICGTMIAIVPDEISIKGITIYQIVTTLLLIIFLAIFTIVQTKLNGSWLVNDTMDKTSDRVLRAYDYVRNYNSKEAGKKSIIKAAIFSIVTLVCIVMKMYSIAVICGVGYTQSGLHLQKATGVKF